jgi:hypothetical protein
MLEFKIRMSNLAKKKIDFNGQWAQSRIYDEKI